MQNAFWSNIFIFLHLLECFPKKMHRGIQNKLSVLLSKLFTFHISKTKRLNDYYVELK